MKYCISEKIGLIPRDVCARPNTFEILTVRRMHKGEKDTLNSWVQNTVSTTRYVKVICPHTGYARPPSSLYI